MFECEKTRMNHSDYKSMSLSTRRKWYIISKQYSQNKVLNKHDIYGLIVIIKFYMELYNLIITKVLVKRKQVKALDVYNIVKGITRLLKYYIILTNAKDLQKMRNTKEYIDNKSKFIKLLNKNKFIQVDKILEQQYNIFDSEEDNNSKLLLWCNNKKYTHENQDNDNNIEYNEIVNDIYYENDKNMELNNIYKDTKQNIIWKPSVLKSEHYTALFRVNPYFITHCVPHIKTIRPEIGYFDRFRTEWKKQDKDVDSITPLGEDEVRATPDYDKWLAEIRNLDVLHLITDDWLKKLKILSQNDFKNSNINWSDTPIIVTGNLERYHFLNEKVQSYTIRWNCPD